MTRLFLVRVPLKLQPFTSWALRQGYLKSPPGDGSGRPRSVDIGYAVHAVLTGLFGTDAPRPFCWPSLGQRERRRISHSNNGLGSKIDVLGYARHPIERLKAFVDQDKFGLSEVVDWECARSKSMQGNWRDNLQLCFDLRACPVRRLMTPLAVPYGSSHENRTFSKGSEVDAYQVAAVRALERSEAKPTRDQAYIHWLTERLTAKSGSATAVSVMPNSVTVTSYRSVRLLRRPRRSSGGRTASWLTRPAVRFSGVLEIHDSEAFADLLTGGIGRHCGFGFGMLLLQPA